MNWLVNWILEKVLKRALDKLPLDGKKTVLGIFVLALSYAATFLPAEAQGYINVVIEFLSEAGAIPLAGKTLPEILAEVGAFITALGLFHKALKVDPRK